MPGRTAKQCRERFVNHLAGGLKVGDWTQEVRTAAENELCSFVLMYD